MPKPTTFRIDGQAPKDEQKIASLEQKLKAATDALKRERALSESLAESRQRALKVSSKAIAPAKHRARLRGDKIRFIFGDTHGSHHEPKVLAAILADIKRLNPHEIVMLGDMINCGGFLAQHHTLGYVSEMGEASYEADIIATAAILDAVQKAAPRARIVWLEGNHDERPERWCVTQSMGSQRDADFLLRQFAPQYLLKLKERGIAYYRRSVHYDGLPMPGVIKLDKCYFYHGTSSARHAASVNVQKVGGNIVFGHIHRVQQFQVRPVATGEICAWSVGCACKLAPLWQHGAPNDWSHGEGVQIITPAGKFLHLNVPILDGESLLLSLFNDAK